jgi:hypothetical protein
MSSKKANISIPTIKFRDLDNESTRGIFRRLKKQNEQIWLESEVTLTTFFKEYWLPIFVQAVSESGQGREGCVLRREIFKDALVIVNKALEGDNDEAILQALTKVVQYFDRKYTASHNSWLESHSGTAEIGRLAYLDLKSFLQRPLDIFGVIS